MKNTLSTRSPEIHPSYYEFALETKTAKTPSPTRVCPSLAQMVHITELFTLLVVSALAISSISQKQFGHVASLVTAPIPIANERPAEQSIDVERQFEQVGQILDYLLKRIDDTSPTLASSQAQSSKTCRVSVTKALLRQGPGKNFSPLMAIDYNSELVIQDESAEWLQVVAPTGQMAWVSRDVVKL